MIFTLETGYGGGDVKCPHCQNDFNVEWDTEYGDALLGEHDDAICPNCNKQFTLGVYYTYYSHA